MSNDKYDDEVDHDLDADLGDEYFDDHDSTSDADGDWDDMEEGSYEQPKKKKKSLSNVIIIAVAVLAGLGFLAFKFGGSSQGTETPPVVEVAAEEVPAPTADVQDITPVVSSADASGAPVESDPMTQALQSGNGVPPAQIPSQTEQGMEAQPDMAAPPQASDPLTPMPVEPEVAQNEEPPLLQGGLSQEPPPLMTSPDVAPEPAPTPAPVEPAPVADQEQPPMLQPVSDFPSADMIKKVETPAPTLAPEPVAAAEEVPAPAPVMQEPAPVVEQQGSAELQQAFDKIKQLEDSADKNDRVIQGYEDQVTSLKDKIAELEGKLDKAAKETVSTGDKKAVPVKEVEPEVKSETPEKSNSAKEEAPIRWVLKGAQPGRALLAAYDQKQADVRTVTVGDKVSGLGTILSIEKGQSGWVVLGTTGKVTQ